MQVLLRIKRNLKRWDRSNRISLVIIKRGIPEDFRGIVPDKVTNAKGFLESIEKCFVKKMIRLKQAHLASLISMRYKVKEMQRFPMHQQLGF